MIGASTVQRGLFSLEIIPIIAASIKSKSILFGGVKVFFMGVAAKIACGVGTYFIIVE